MSRLFPQKQQFVDLRDGDIVQICKVILIDQGSGEFDFFALDGASDVALLQTSRTTADPTFYLTQGVLNIEGGTAGAEHLVVSRHGNQINFKAGGS